jgi:uncharacterized protein (TIGR03435 family)
MTRATIVAALAFLPASVAFSQSGASLPAFDVASIKLDTSSGSKPGKAKFLPGRISFPNGTLKRFIMAAFQVPGETIVGGPAWLDSERFDLVAKAAPNTDDKTLRAMLQTLLAERFHLVTHQAEKAMAEYGLTVGKGGPKLQPSPQPGVRQCTWESGDQTIRRRVCHNMTMAQLASALPGWGGIGVDRPVVDLTGLTGTYDFQFEIGPAGKKGTDGKDATGPTIFDAMAQLGLKLESRKGTLATIVIDHAEKPSAN